MRKDLRYENLQKTLKSLRVKENVTQYDLSVRLGKPQSYISKYESGERRLDIIEFIDICTALSLKPAEILKLLHKGKPPKF